MIYIVDDDEAVRDALSILLESIGYEHECFETAQVFLEDVKYQPEKYKIGAYETCCLLLDVRMPGMSGMQLQQQLLALDVELPIIFITGHGDISMAVAAIKAGAVDFLTKPFAEKDLLRCLDSAFDRYRELVINRERNEGVLRLYESLTPREKEILKLLVAGKSNKVIGYDLDISQRTVEVHRARVMSKMECRSLADLVKQGALLGLS